MAYASWLNIPIDHGRSGPVYRLWDAVARLLSGSMVGTWSIIDTSEGATPSWAGDTDPADGAWIVIQSESAWAGGAKLQVFLGFRATTGSLAGFGSKAAGLYCAFSTDGGFDTTAHYFGASLADWRNGSIRQINGFTSACTLCLVLTSGATGRAGSCYVLTRQGTATHTMSFGVAAGVPPISLAESLSRTAMFFGSPSVHWTTLSASNGLVVNVAVSGLSAALCSVLGDYAADRNTGVRVEGDLISLRDYTAGQSFGMLPLVYRCSAADGDVSVGGTRWVWEGWSWPREVTRDGSWV